jgi:hypothetical protein
MADHPILFSAPMIRAILEGRKTQTRRMLTPQPAEWMAGVIDIKEPTFDEDEGGWGQWQTEWSGETFGSRGEPLREFWVPLRGLRYAVGDLFWVREAWRTYGVLDDTPPRDLWKPGGDRGAAVFYDADGGNLGLSKTGERFYGERGTANRSSFGKLRPGMFMPRWASRITLRVEAVTVERLQDISEADAKAEGALSLYGEPYHADSAMTDRRRFELLWESINGPGSWGANPWIAAYTFEPIFQNIDQVKP